MKKNGKYLEWEKCVLWLSQHSGWWRPYELERQFVKGQIIGSESDTRLGEVFGTLESQPQQIELKIGEDTFTLQTKKERGGRMYQVPNAIIKPKPQVKITVNEVGEVVAQMV